MMTEPQRPVETMVQAPRSHRQFAYRRSADQDARQKARHQVVIVGAGPVGLSLAIDLAQRGIRSVLIDDSDRIGDGSRAICFAKRTLEIFDRLGVGERALAKGVQWQTGRVFHRSGEIYAFDLLPEAGHKMPAFINLQQYYVEEYLSERALALDAIDLRWRNTAVNIAQLDDGVCLTVETPEGRYTIEAEYLVACDGARSPVRTALGIDFKGEVFEDQFLIADVKMTAAFPTERWFWFEPPFHSGQSALLHKQPDDIWRIDLQLSPDADATHERRPSVVRPRIEAMLGRTDFELEWVSVYRFQCRRIDRFVHDRIVFAGDAAHQVSPFGARGANSGVQDAENLAWKLAAVLDGVSPPALIESYHSERSAAADENIRHSTRATDFIAPHSDAERTLRDAALALAPKAEFAKRMVNSGRLSAATHYTDSALSTGDVDDWHGGPQPGLAVPDVPLTGPTGARTYLSMLLGRDFTLLVFGRAAAPVMAGITVVTIGDGASFGDPDGLFARRFDARFGTAYLIRPDSHVAARFRTLTGAGLQAAVERARGLV
jgi:3-(3-hydroxy-phenyl)propionate hydroxylase